MEMDMQSQVIPTESSRQSGSAFSRFILKTGFVLFLTVDISAGFLYLLYSRKFQWMEVIPSALAVFSGLVAGTLARVFYKNTPKFFRWIIACMVTAITLAIAGLVIQEWIHIDLTGIWYALIKPDFAILTGMGWITALVAVYAWQGKSKVDAASQVSPVVNAVIPFEPVQDSMPVRRLLKTKKSASSRKRSLSIFPKDIRNRTFRKNAWQRWIKKSKTDLSHTMRGFERNILNPVGLFFNNLVATKPRNIRTANRIAAQPEAHRTILPVLSPTPLPRKRLGRKMHDSIRLVGKEELRCPYCLQIVERRDPKGIVICPICKSAHHKECWDITGSCQVPHNHAVL
jgi:hypothetical protein